MNDNLIEFVKNHIEKGSKLLDLGAGDFSDVNELNELGFACKGVDLKTGVDLEKPYLSGQAPFDCVSSNFVLHFLKNKKALIESAFNNLKSGGYFFFQDLERSDLTTDMYFYKDEMKHLIEDCGFKIIKTRKFKFFDDKPDHMHWHDIIEIIAQK
jgi:SAM-dependent methyltransferase